MYSQSTTAILAEPRLLEPIIVSHPIAELTYLHVGENSEAARNIAPYFHAGYFAKNLLHAQLILTKLSEHSLPAAIFIDAHYNQAEFNSFISFLEKEHITDDVILIYNENKLDKELIKSLKGKSLVDDIIDFSDSDINFKGKTLFLSAVKDKQTSLLINQKGRLAQRFTKSSHAIPVFKRAFDIIFAVVSLIFALPLMAIIALAIKLESKGPAIYRARRAGMGFKIFDFFKFRTMEVGADKKLDEVKHLNQYGDSSEEMKFLKICNDPRVTRLGKFLRNTSLDELPQLFNVLKGDMSIVGNRPLPLYEASTLTTDDAVERFMAPAGITGLWQVKKRGQDDMSSEERIMLDIIYARKYSFKVDLWIIAQTPMALLQKRNV